MVVLQIQGGSEHYPSPHFICRLLKLDLELVVADGCRRL